MSLTHAEELDFKYATHCHICEKKFRKKSKNIPVRDHDHIVNVTIYVARIDNHLIGAPVQLPDYCIFGKTMENLRNRVSINLVTDENKLVKLIIQDVNGITTRCKIYNKMVQMLESYVKRYLERCPLFTQVSISPYDEKR